MDDLKQINLSESNVNEATQMEDRVMEPVKKSKTLSIIISTGIVLGLVAGFFIAQKELLLANGGVSLTSTTTQELTSATNVKVGDVFGSADEKTFRDQAEGILMAGGIDGEGSHHIERGANKTQWVYITSSVVDLDLLVGDRVTIWGETNQGKKAGWLMDVGRLKVQELNVAPATESTKNE
ncbi:hypothetical protein KBD75_02470 [Candidatus Woesebacteria bacterium]|nr:hypothetical protein [Candidatus Woesebacteria bacterium]